jgi:hypothetical protein
MIPLWVCYCRNIIASQLITDMYLPRAPFTLRPPGIWHWVRQRGSKLRGIQAQCACGGEWAAYLHSLSKVEGSEIASVSRPVQNMINLIIDHHSTLQQLAKTSQGEKRRTIVINLMWHVYQKLPFLINDMIAHGTSQPATSRHYPHRRLPCSSSTVTILPLVRSGALTCQTIPTSVILLE